MSTSIFLDRNPLTVGRNTSVREAIVLLCGSPRQTSDCLLIVEPDFVGIATKGDLLRAIANGKNPQKTTVEQIASSPAISLEWESFTPETALLAMDRHGISYLPILKESQVEGVVSRSSLAVARLQQTVSQNDQPQSEDFYRQIVDTISALIVVLNPKGQIVSFNRSCEELTGYSLSEVQGRSLWELQNDSQEQVAVKQMFQQILADGLPHRYTGYWTAKNGDCHLISWLNYALSTGEKIDRIIVMGIDISEQRQVWLELQQQYRQYRLLADVTRKIRLSIELTSILQTTVTEVQKLLRCDRVLIVKIRNHTALPISEAVADSFPPMLGYELRDPLLVGAQLAKYRQGEVLAIDNLSQSDVAPELKELLRQFAIQAELVVPILVQTEIKGLLVVHHCRSPRIWQTREIDLLVQLADAVGVALSQAELLHHLEAAITERTSELTITNQLLKAEITERERTEAALRENQQKLGGILDNADEAIISVNEEQRIQLFNQGAEKIFGYRSAEAIGKHLDLLLPEAFRQIHRQHIAQFQSSATKARTMAERSTNVFGLRRDGIQFPAEASVAKLRTREGMLFTVMLKDITEKEQTRAKLQASQRLLAKAEAIAKIGSWEYSLASQETIWSAELFIILDFEPKKIPTLKQVLRRVHPEDRALTLEQFRQGYQGKPWHFQFRYLGTNGIKYLESRGEPTVTKAGIASIWGTAIDITERQEMERLKSEFVSIASHEMRTPLTAIHGIIKLLGAGHLGTLSEKGTSMVEIARQNSHRLVNLVNDILDLERLSLGQEQILLQKSSSGELIKLAIDTLEGMAQQQQVVLESQGENLQLYGDRDRLVQTLINLINNAIKFSPSGSKIIISSQLEGDSILFAVRDGGRGIPPDKLESIFERFQQVDASDSRQKGGTGLGLAICRQIVQQHGGEIWAQSDGKSGSTFLFTIPTVRKEP